MDLIPAWDGTDLVPVEKLSVHQRGLRHKAVSVFVMDGDRTLVQRRALSKYHTPGLWANTCCTHPRWLEDPKSCAIRRLNEELGITGLTPVLRDKIEYRAAVGNGLIEHEVVDLFVAEANSDLTMTLNPDEVADAVWIKLAGLRADIAEHPAQYTPWLRIYMAEHGARIFARGRKA